MGRAGGRRIDKGRGGGGVRNKEMKGKVQQKAEKREWKKGYI